ncbi:MAG: hypothetical protein KTR32_22450 [Granulosicoccus sp.]|nr:hypothetical protein [Granulosicoccus sp.]
MDIEVLKRAYEREKARRIKAEELLESKSRELYTSFESLQRSHWDLTDAIQEIQSQQHQLVQSEKMASLGIMSAGVAHEINNPIAFVHSNVNSLDEALKQFKRYNDLVKDVISAESDDDKAAKIEVLQSFSADQDLDYLFQDCTDLIQDTVEGIERVKGIVVDLQSFARVDSGEKERVDIPECIRNTLRLAHNQIKDSAEVFLEFDDVPEIPGFPGKLNQVFLNLIVNAGHAIGADGGSITIRIKDLPASISVAVTDTGCGLDQTTIDRIFTPFFTTKPVGKGTGLGLSISHGIVKEHQGKITVQSELNVGTTFTVLLAKGDQQVEAA